MPKLKLFCTTSGSYDHVAGRWVDEARDAYQAALSEWRPSSQAKDTAASCEVR